ncbi:uncharacterized protein LOC108907987 [Anoplophora glabripennis]|uniref:uncharacterized protein LOC108907987 n=1 Tax=Anoplophora glabripennis TaxID=217634 RepID=UPI0008755498|nr:uncharacterized protein LOC108907987 [Anoplophora glabripennis]
MSRCLDRLRYRCCDCSLKTFGFVYGWMGVILRIVVTMFLAVTLSRITDYDHDIFAIGLITALTYVQVSLVSCLFFIIGIQKDKPYFLLPYTVIGGMELALGLGVFIFITVIFSKTVWKYLLAAFIPVSLLIMGIYMYFWIKSIQLFRQMEIDVSRKIEETARIESLRQSLALY